MKKAKPSPPLLTGGLENKTSSLSLDWIEGTFKGKSLLTYPPEFTTVKTECKPFNGYTVAVKYADGRIELNNPSRPEMGIHIVLSGQVLRNLPIEPMEALRWFINSGMTMTRLDCCLDALNYGLKPSRSTELLEAGDCLTTARRFPLWRELGMGYTQYFGTKSSQIYTRVYDKAKEQGIDGDWTRVETVFQSRRAILAGEQILKGKSILSLIRGHVDFPTWGEWKELFTSTPTTLKREYKDSNTRLWLLKTAAPSLAREIIYDDEFVMRFYDAVKFEVDQMKAKFSEEKPS